MNKSVINCLKKLRDEPNARSLALGSRHNRGCVNPISNPL